MNNLFSVQQGLQKLYRDNGEKHFFCRYLLDVLQFTNNFNIKPQQLPTLIWARRVFKWAQKHEVKDAQKAISDETIRKICQRDKSSNLEYEYNKKRKSLEIQIQNAYKRHILQYLPINGGVISLNYIIKQLRQAMLGDNIDKILQSVQYIYDESSDYSANSVEREQHTYIKNLEARKQCKRYLEAQKLIIDIILNI